MRRLLTTPKIFFSSSYLEGVIPGHNDPMIILLMIVIAEVKKVFMDQGSSVYIIFRDTFNKLRLKNSDFQTYKEELIGFSGEKLHLNGYVTFSTLNKIDAIVSTVCLTMKFFIANKEIAIINRQ